jgi:hypothetical protein
MKEMTSFDQKKHIENSWRSFVSISTTINTIFLCAVTDIVYAIESYHIERIRIFTLNIAMSFSSALIYILRIHRDEIKFSTRRKS